MISGGTRLCSGAMINNAKKDGRQLFLTANHCLFGYDNWVLGFNYQSPVCDNLDGPTNFTAHGVNLLARNSYSDFALFEVVEKIPESYSVFLSGWSRRDDPPPFVVGIHHPSGDVKKISLSKNKISASDYFAEQGTSHWKVAEWSDGTTEKGSSGSPVFDDHHRIVGQAR